MIVSTVKEPAMEHRQSEKPGGITMVQAWK
jgi:hypothetical protein